MKRIKGTLPDPTPKQTDRVCEVWDQTSRHVQRKLVAKLTARVCLLEDLAERLNKVINLRGAGEQVSAELFAEIVDLREQLGIVFD